MSFLSLSVSFSLLLFLCSLPLSSLLSRCGIMFLLDARCDNISPMQGTSPLTIDVAEDTDVEVGKVANAATEIACEMVCSRLPVEVLLTWLTLTVTIIT